MKWKIKASGEVFVEDNNLNYLKRLIPDWEKYFEPVYDYGQFVWVQDTSYFERKTICEVIDCDKAGDWWIRPIINNDVLSRWIDYDKICVGGGASIISVATPKEIKKATKKFPFKYKSLPSGMYEFTVIDGHDPKQVSIDDDEGYSIVLTQSAWQEIGKRKGWNLE